MLSEKLVTARSSTPSRLRSLKMTPAGTAPYPEVGDVIEIVLCSDIGAKQHKTYREYYESSHST